MSLLNIFKRKKKEAPKQEEKKRPVAVAARKEEEQKQEPKKEEAAQAVKPRAESAVAYRVLKKPHVTEKATMLAERNQYIFDVQNRANKPEVKRAVEEVYGVNVVAVRMARVPPKKRRRGKIEGWRKGYKKAIVRVKEGQKIEVLPR